MFPLIFPVYEVSFTNMCCCCRFLSIFPSSCLFCFPFAVGCRGRSSCWITKFQTKNFRQSDFAWPRISHVFLERWSSHHGNETRWTKCRGICIGPAWQFRNCTGSAPIGIIWGQFLGVELSWLYFKLYYSFNRSFIYLSFVVVISCHFIVWQ